MTNEFWATIAQSSGWSQSEIAQSFSAAIALAVLIVVYVAVTRHFSRKFTEAEYGRRDRLADTAKRLRDMN